MNETRSAVLTEAETLGNDLSDFEALRTRFEKFEFPETLGDLVRNKALSLGDKVLGNWFDEGETLTYRQLHERADRLASSFLKLGVRKGTHVAILLPNVPAFPITWVALARLGAVMVPVNTAYTAKELHFILEDSDAQFLVVDDSFRGMVEAIDQALPLLGPSRIIIHRANDDRYLDWHELVRRGDFPFSSPFSVSRNDLLNLQYTSGTTGFPKGCLLSHDYWILIGHYSATFRVKDDDVKNILIWAPFFYMDPMWQFLMSVVLGATAHVARRFSLTGFYGWLKEYRINYCTFPEPAYKVLPESAGAAEVELTYIGIYGWQRDLRSEVQSRFNVIGREAYGMTEIGGATIVPHGARLKALDYVCGVPAPFREMRIVDEAGNDVADGERGELWVAGRSILWGYYKRPEANAESFRGKWFRTGDVFVRDKDGFYAIVGRTKDMIKRSGENIAAQEVEAVLKALPAVAEAAVLAVPDPMRKEEVKAYLLLREGRSRADLPPEDVIKHCRAYLAAFKVPRFITYVDEFPRTPSRKIQKSKLLSESIDPRAGSWDREEGRWL